MMSAHDPVNGVEPHSSAFANALTLIVVAIIFGLVNAILKPIISDATQRNEVVNQVVDDANPQAVAGLIGPGKPLPDNVTEDDEVFAAADDAFITGIRVAMFVGFLVAVAAFIVGWILFPRKKRESVSDEVVLEPG